MYLILYSSCRNDLEDMGYKEEDRGKIKLNKNQKWNEKIKQDFN